jgi:hypothetical protein
VSHDHEQSPCCSIHDPWFTHTGGAAAMARTLAATARAAEDGG